MENLPTPDFIVKCGVWIIHEYKTRHEVWCWRNDGKTLIVKLRTDEILNIPQYVIGCLLKYDLLTEWRNCCICRSLQRLHKTIDTYKRYLDNKQAMPN